MMRRTFSSAPFHPLRSWQAPVRALPHPSPRFVRQGAPIARRQYAGWEQPERRGLWGAFLAYSRVHPIRAGAAIFVTSVSTAFLILTIYVAYKFDKDMQESYPPSVSKPLRKAIYWSEHGQDLAKSADYYERALLAADAAGMDPMSDEVIGVRLSFAQMYIKIGHEQTAIAHFESIRADCRRHLDSAAATSNLPRQRGERERTLTLIVRLSFALAQLYGAPNVRNVAEEGRNYELAIQTAVGEQQRRAAEGQQEGEEEWLTDDSLRGIWEALGDFYARVRNFRLAAPCLMAAYALGPPSCHRATLMQRIGNTLQHVEPDPGADPVETREGHLANARVWLEKSLAEADSFQASDEGNKCSACRAMVTMNLAENDLWEGLPEEGQRKIVKVEAMMRAWNDMEGLAIAQGIRERIQQVLAKHEGSANDTGHVES